MKMLRLHEVVRRVTLSRATIYRMMHLGRFPKPMRIGLRTKAWIEEEVDAWFRERDKERNVTKD